MSKIEQGREFINWKSSGMQESNPGLCDAGVMATVTSDHGATEAADMQLLKVRLVLLWEIFNTLLIRIFKNQMLLKCVYHYKLA